MGVAVAHSIIYGKYLTFIYYVHILLLILPILSIWQKLKNIALGEYCFNSPG